MLVINAAYRSISPQRSDSNDRFPMESFPSCVQNERFRVGGVVFGVDSRVPCVWCGKNWTSILVSTVASNMECAVDFTPMSTQRRFFVEGIRLRGGGILVGVLMLWSNFISKRLADRGPRE